MANDQFAGEASTTAILRPHHSHYRAVRKSARREWMMEIVLSMSALGHLADIRERTRDVRFIPKSRHAIVGINVW
jgi:hypothetical protein